VAFVVRQYLVDLELEIAAKIKASGASESEKAALGRKVEEQVAEFRAQCERSFRRLQAEMEELKADSARRGGVAVHRAFASLAEKLDYASDVSALRKVIEQAEVTVRNDLDVRICTIGREINSEVAAIADRYARNLTDAMAGWNRILLEEFNIDRPFVAKIPPILIDTLLVVIWNYFLPFGWLTALVAYAVGKNLGLNTNNIMKPILLSQAKSKFAEAETQVGQQVEEQIRTNVDSVFFSLKEAIEEYNQSQVEKMRKMVENDEVSSGRGELEKAKADIAAAIESLN